MNNKQVIAEGTFTWDSPERRSRRYGSFYTDTQDSIGNQISEKTFVDTKVLRKFNGKKVKLTAHVNLARDSTHMGDRFLLREMDDLDTFVRPSTPKVGEDIVIGVGYLTLEDCLATPVKHAIGLKPDDGRESFWIDPAILYRLHEQDVTVYVELTDEDFSPLTALHDYESDDAISNGNGTIQHRGNRAVLNIAPKIVRLGDGLFSVSSPDMTAGARLKVTAREDHE